MTAGRGGGEKVLKLTGLGIENTPEVLTSSAAAEIRSCVIRVMISAILFLPTLPPLGRNLL